MHSDIELGEAQSAKWSHTCTLGMCALQMYVLYMGGGGCALQDVCLVHGGGGVCPTDVCPVHGGGVLYSYTSCTWEVVHSSV